MSTALEAAYLRAKRDYRLAEAAWLDERLSAMEHPADEVDPTRPSIDLSRFDPKWKNGIKLSKAGEAAIRFAYSQFMPQSKVRALFDISSTAAHNWHEKWKRSQRPTN